MKKVCYFCGNSMGVKGDYPKAGVFYSVCEECSCRKRLDKRLPELVLAIADLRMRNVAVWSNLEQMEQPQPVGVLSIAR